MNWLYYLLEANLYLIIFYGFYKLTLQKETFYTLNRLYLLFSPLLAFTLPFFQFGFLKAPIIAEPIFLPVEEIDQIYLQDIPDQAPIRQSILSTENVLTSLYVAIALLCLAKLLFSLFQVLRMRNGKLVELENGIKIIPLEQSKLAFSFFNLLFLDPQLPERNIIIRHELVHIRQKHSIDVLFCEFLQVINWFNPVLYLMKKDVKLIHEYLADEETTKMEVARYDYAIFLIKNSTRLQGLKLGNQIFNSSLLKKRINMLNQRKSAKRARLKLLLVLPIAIAIICTSTMAFTKDYGVIDINLANDQTKSSIKQDTVKKPFRSNEISVPNLRTINIHLRFDAALKKPMPITKKLFVFNGKICKPGMYGGAKNVDRIILLDAANGFKKYGARGKHGVIEVQGSKAVLLDIPPPPPPIESPPKVAPPPPPPPIEPPPPPKQPSKNTLKPAPSVSLKPTDGSNKSGSIIIDRSKDQKLVFTQNEDHGSIRIVDRWGKEIYKNNNYLNDWDGKSNEIKAGTYFFIYNEINSRGDTASTQRGFINILDSTGDI